MIKELLLQEIKEIGIKSNSLDIILDEAIFEVEQIYGKNIKQIPPTIKEKEFIIETVKTLLSIHEEKEKLDEEIEEFLKSDKNFKDYINETVTVSGAVSNITRGGLYDTTRTLVNGGTVDQNISNIDQDDRNLEDKSDMYNNAVDEEKPNLDFMNDFIGENGIGQEDYFGKETEKEVDTDIYEIGKAVSFKNDEEGEVQEGDIIEVIKPEDSDYDVISYRVSVTKGNDAGKMLVINKTNLI